MTALNFQRPVFHFGKTDAFLRAGNGWGRLNCCTEQQRHTVCNAAQDTAAAIGFRNNRAVLYAERVIAFTAPEPGKGKARAELYTLYGWNAVKDLGKLSLHTAKHGCAQSGRQAGNRAFNDAANAVAAKTGILNGLLHGCAFLTVQNGENGINFMDLRCDGIKGKVFNTGNGCNVGRDGNTHVLQPLFAEPAGNAQRSRQPAGEMPSAGCVLIAPILDLGGIVRVTGSGTIKQITVIAGTGIVIPDGGGNGGAAGESLQ